MLVARVDLDDVAGTIRYVLLVKQFLRSRKTHSV